MGTPSVFYLSFAQLKDDYWLHYRGTVARTSEVTYFHHYHKISTIQVCVACVSQTGHRHHEGIDYDPAFIEPDQSLPMIIRCDPASPLRISISWGRQILLSRTVAFEPNAFFSALFELCGLMALVQSLIKRDVFQDDKSKKTLK